MKKNKVLKQLLAVSAVAALFSTFSVNAQTSQSASQMSESKQGTPATVGATTTRDGTAGNTDSQGKDERTGARGASGSQSTTAAGSSSTGAPAPGMTDKNGSGAAATTGSTAATGQTGATGTTAAGTSAGGKAMLSKADQKIVMDMARANMAEIEAGKLALSKTQNDQVKSFAQQMVDDHTKALGEVEALAQAKGVTMPTELDKKHKAMASKLEKLSGDAFDREYMKQAGVSDHKTVLGMLKKDQKSAKDPEVQALAAKMTPTVEQHLKSAQQMPTHKNGTAAGK